MLADAREYSMLEDGGEGDMPPPQIGGRDNRSGWAEVSQQSVKVWMRLSCTITVGREV